MILGFGNNVVSALAGDITTIQTDIPVMPGTGAKFAKLLSADFENKSNGQRIYAKITLTDNKESAFEICHLVSVSGDVLKVIRGQEGTTAKGWSLNDVVANFATRGSENHFVQIAQLQSGHYIAGVAGGTANALTLELPSTFFVNGGTDWTLRTPIIVFPVQNNTNAATLQLTLGGKVLGTFPLYKGNKSELVANDIIKGIPLICLLDSEKSYFSVINPGNIYSDFDLRYVKKSGDTLSGGLTFENDSILAWIRNTDWAKLGFKNDSDSDTDSYLWFEAGDNGNEYFKWRSKYGTTTKDLMNLKWDALYVLVNAIINGEVVSKSANGFRIAYGNYGFFVRNDGSNTYFMLTNAGDSMGSYNGLRPFCINNATGAVTMGNGLTVSGGLNVSSGNITAGGGQVIPGNYSNFDARYQTKTGGVQDVRLGGYQQMGSTGSNLAPSGYVSVGGYCYGEWDNSADGWFIRPLQKLINGTWYNVASM
ncbi:phage tail protein [Escherichia coli]|uniref:phage tail fiber protein n=1 Tax=Escherichia coli TaxID=562 RepID=UPI0032B52AC2